MTAKEKTAEMALLYQNGRSLAEIGEQFGMTRQGVRERFIKAGIARRKTKYEQIDKSRLDRLYSVDRLLISKIADVFSVNPSIIRRALELYKIPRRPPITLGGYKVDFLRSLEVGENRVIESRGDRYVHLHDTANRIGIKISIRSRGANRFEVTRLR